jgi:GNAT superfamily N-acetyltransferase
MEIRRIDRTSHELDEWCALLAAGMAAEAGSGLAGAGIAARARAERPDADVLRWAALDPAGAVVGVARSGPDRNARFVRLFVPEEHRGTGVGAALLEAARTAHPASVLKSVTVAGQDGERFAAHHGATVLMRLTVMEQRLDHLTAFPESRPGRSVVLWNDSAPDDLVDSYAAAYNHLSDAPDSHHQLAVAAHDRDRIRRWESDIRTGGRELWVCAVVEPAGASDTVVAFTEIEAGPEPEASQHTTAVLPSHRRRGLGLLVKQTLAHHLHAARPHITTVSTTVNEANTAMVELNRRAGYRTVRTRLLLELPPASPAGPGS